jgi:hypothetical protein
MKKIYKKKSPTLFVRKACCIFLLGVFLCMFSVHAQPLPVGVAFDGEWFFARAEALEKPKGTEGDYSTRNVLEEEFLQKTYFYHIPTQITFIDGFFARLSHPSWKKPMVAVINPSNDNLLEFREFQENFETSGKFPNLADFEPDAYPTTSPVYAISMEENLMLLQCNYFYSKAKGEYIDGILKIYYKH